MTKLYVKISGLNLIRVINKLSEKNVYIENLTIKSNSIKFVIDENKLQILNEICKKEHKFYQIIQKNGFKQIIASFPYMIGTIFAFILISLYIFSFSLFVYNVNVSYSSNVNYDLTNVNNLLNDNGIVSGMRMNKYTISEIQNLIMLGMDDVEGCEVRFLGNNLNITIFPAVKKYEKNLNNIFSKYDAVIEYAEAYSGKLKVKSGDIAKVGDLLIENDNGASGKIIGKIYFSATRIYNEKQQKLIYTGKKYKIKDFIICNKTITSGKNNCNFKQYLSEKCSFYICKNVFLPIKCNETILYEIQFYEDIVPFSDVEDEIKDKVFEDAKLKVPNNCEIVNVTYSILKENNYTRVDCFIETKIDLCDN